MLPPRKISFEAERDATHLGMPEDAFVKKYLRWNEQRAQYETSMPCGFLQEDGQCLLGDCKPDNCKKFPYTDQPERLQSLYNVLDAVSVCPVAFEIYERLKKEYHFER